MLRIVLPSECIRAAGTSIPFCDNPAISATLDQNTAGLLPERFVPVARSSS